MKKLLGFLLALTVILSLAACGDNNVYLKLDDALLQTGESFTLTPHGLPEGFTVADCALSLYHPLHSSDEKDVVRVDDTGTVTALRTGLQRVHCELNYKGKCYLGSCSVEVVDALVLDAESLVLIQGEHCALAAKSASGVSVGSAVRWESGDASIAAIAKDMAFKHNEMIITAKAAGETTVTASLGDKLQAVCRVTVLANDDVETYPPSNEQLWPRISDAVEHIPE